MTGLILAWHNNPDLKAQAVARMRAHREADTFVQGLYAEVDPDAARQYRGCFHGCLTAETLAAERGEGMAAFLRGMHDGGEYISWHAEGERLWGIPQPVGQLLDRCFEQLPPSAAGVFAVAATEAVPVGADLSLVAPRVMLDLLVDDDGQGANGVLQYTAAGKAQHTAVEAVAGLYRRRLAGDEPARDEWLKARFAASASASYASAAYAAYTASAADDAAADAADAADDATYAAAQVRRYEWIAARLIHHLGTAPVAVVA